MAENLDPTEPQPAASSLTLTPLTRRNHPPADRPVLPPDIEEQFNQLNQAVQVLSAHFFGETSAPPTENLKERGARRIKKFQRAGGDERPAGSTPGDEHGTDAPADENLDPAGVSDPAESLALNKHIAWPRQTADGEPIVPTRAPAPWWERAPLERYFLPGAGAAALLLLGLGIVLGHFLPFGVKNGRATGGSGHKASDLFGPSELTEQAFLTANEAMHAEHAGNAEAARKIYETSLAKRVSLPGMNYRLGLLALLRNDRLEAEQRLERSALDGENLAASCYLLARIAADRGDLDEEAMQFERAERAEPFDGRHFFFYGEVLRRQGKPQAAITAFEQALDRPYTAASGDLYLFKQRLAKIEYGRDDVFNAELVTRLKDQNLAGEWLLLAAAQDLDHQSYSTAVEHLRQAATRLPSNVYADLTHDYFFQTQAKRPELTALLNRTAPVAVSSAGPTVLDPASWSAERADPATWPITSHPADQ